MFQSTRRNLIIGIWLALLVAGAGVAALAGTPVTAGTSALWLVACVVPPSVMLAVWRGAPPLTVAEVLHAVDRQV
jgi:hypothetical protein